MRITAIEIENFKGISERVRVELKPITLLFGANSAGKSTILQALLYMKDVLDRRNLDAITTPVSGRALDLGGFRRFVHGHDLSRPVRIALCLELTGGELPPMALGYELPSDLSSVWEEIAQEFYRAESEILDSIISAKVEIEVRWDEESCEPVSFAYTVGFNGARLIRIERNTESLEEINLAEEEESTTEEMNNPLVLWGILPEFSGNRPPLLGLKNWRPTSQDPIPDFSLREHLYLPEAYCEWTDRDCSEVAKMRAWDGTAFLARLLFGPGKLVQESLQGLRYLGPLRARTPRKGIPSDELSDWSEGLAAWKALQSEENFSDLIGQVSQWLAGKDRLNSGYELQSKHLAQVDADACRQIVEGNRDKAQAQLLELLQEAPKSREIKLVNTRSGLELDPSDVGVGISQVLPIVVAAVAPGASVVAIEQPELHIHPAMQVALGDLFIEGATTRGMSFLIETHSEHLMLRLLRRIRETTEGELPPGGVELSPEDVSVVYVQSGANGVEMVPLLIDETGEFATKWPRGFFDERAEELFG